MATIQTTAKTVTTQQATDFRDAICREYGYQETIANPNFNRELPEDPQTNPATIANPITKATFAQNKLDEFAWTWGRNIVINYRKSLQPPIDTNTGL